MSRESRKLVHLVMVAGFLAACSGMDRAIHVRVASAGHACGQTNCESNSERPATPHAPRQCPVCHELAVGTLAVLDWSPPPLDYLGLVAFSTVCPARAPDLLRHHDPFVPRGPPATDPIPC
ncbi:MAG: hypothetical protein JXQ73_33210 [Phycisphaerae bacterium]|nr:hypothetical protein [Phycisphaerae bacterium]